MGDDREEDRNNVRRRGTVKEKVASKFFLEFALKERIYPKKIGETLKHASKKISKFWNILIKQVLYPFIILRYPYKPRDSPAVEVINSTIQNNIKW